MNANSPPVTSQRAAQVSLFLAGVGRLVSIRNVGLPEPAEVCVGGWPIITTLAHLPTNRNAANGPDVG